MGKTRFNFLDVANLSNLFAMLSGMGIDNCSVHFGKLPGYAVVIAKPTVHLFWYDGEKIRGRRLLESVFNGSGYHNFVDIRVNRKKRRVVVEILTQHGVTVGSNVKPVDRPYKISLEVPLSLLRKRKKK